MPSRTVRCLLLALLGAPLCAGWTVRKGGVSMTTNSFVTRRGILRALPGVAVLPLASSPSHAVLGGVPSGEGGLPEAARQFDNVVRSQKGWESLGSRIEKGGKAGDITNEEWKNVQLYLRQLYTAGDDMAGMAKGLSKDKQGTAAELIKSFKATVKKADDPAAAKDAAGLRAAQKVSSAQLADFLALFQDVPDEL